MSGDGKKNRKDNADWRLGEILIQNGWITWEQLEEALATQRKKKEEHLSEEFTAALDAPHEKKKLQLGEVLVKKKLITWEQLAAALAIQNQTRQMLGEILLERQLVTQKDLYRALAIQLGMTFVDFDTVHIPENVVKMVPKAIAYEHKLMPLICKGNTLLVAVSDPKDPWPQSELAKIRGLEGFEIRMVLSSKEEIERALKKYYGL